VSAPEGTALRPIDLRGDAFARGRAQAVQGAPVAQVRAAMAARLAEARAAGLLTGDGLAYVDRQRAFAEAHCPEAMAEVAGIAEGFGLPEEDVFLHQHLGILRDLAGGGAFSEEGCSAWAVASGPDGPLVVKNRDFSGHHAGIQRVFRHDGPDLAQGPVLCLGSLASPGAYSSGLNAAGLALADTQVGVRRHAVGWPRYFLMTRILARCANVDEALDLIRTVPHAGGGALILADAQGGVAAVELGAACVAVEEAPVVCRTNHFTTTALAGETLAGGGSRIDDSSAKRRAHLDAELPGRAWNVDAAAALMARHLEDCGAPLCQHAAGPSEARTLASTVYRCRAGVLHACLDAPCTGTWHRLPVAAGAFVRQWPTRLTS